MSFDLTAPIYTDADAARAHLETLHWPDGAFCPHCGSFGVTRLMGKSTRPGVYKCRGCRKLFTVTVGTVFEDSKIPLNKWLLAFRLMASSKKGISAHQLHRSIGITYKSAWFMAHRIREAMGIGPDAEPLGGENKVVEADDVGSRGYPLAAYRCPRVDGCNSPLALGSQSGDQRPRWHNTVKTRVILASSRPSASVCAASAWLPAHA